MTPPSFPLAGAALNAVIASPRVRLEPLGAHHAAAMFEGLQYPQVYRWISMAPPPDLAQLEARWGRVAASALSADNVFDLGWAAFRVEDGACIGKLDAEILAHGVATNVGYLFFPPFWGHGYASEAVRALSEHLVRHGVVEQRATVTVGNDASCRVLERAGFVRERVIPANDVLRGVVVDDIEYVRRD